MKNTIRKIDTGLKNVFEAVAFVLYTQAGCSPEASRTDPGALYDKIKAGIIKAF